MRHALIIILLSIIGFSLLAQSEEKGIPITLAIYAPYGIQFGGKVGTTINFKVWEAAKTNKKSCCPYARTFFVSPQIGFFVRPNNHNSLLLNSEAGFKNIKHKRRFYTAYTIGLGYLNTFQILSSTIDLSTGEIVARKRERRAYFLPGINFECGQDAKRNVAWYSKFAFGRKISNNIEDSSFFALELGLKVYFNKR